MVCETDNYRTGERRLLFGNIQLHVRATSNCVNSAVCGYSFLQLSKWFGQYLHVHMYMLKIIMQLYIIL